MLLFLALFVGVKAAFGVMRSDVGRAVTMVYAKIPIPASPRDTAQTKLIEY
jgi:hypothetical protein